MHEIIVNLHMHTRFSDGNGFHQDIAHAAIKAGIDAVIVTDHNVWVSGLEGYTKSETGRVLVLIGEEVHDQAHQPQKNHLLVFGTDQELAHLAADPQTLIDGVNDAGGMAFLAHPDDPAAPFIGERSLAWVDWDISGYRGIELWNAMTEFKSLMTGFPAALFYAFNFKSVAHGPFPKTLKRWDKLLAEGRPIVAIGGSDAHQIKRSLGPITRLLFPYESHFRAVNTHLFIPSPLTGNAQEDKQKILTALRKGNAFVGNDLPASTRGFRFSASTAQGEYIAGDTIIAQDSVTLQVKLPTATECHILKDGEIVRSGIKRDSFIHKTDGPGVYRVEAYIQYRGKRRGWIFSNPIYVKGQ